jgi:hypothetical protein
MVYSVQTMPAEDEHIPPLMLSPSVTIVKDNNEEFTMDQDTETKRSTLRTATTTATESSTDTAPASPVNPSAAARIREHVNKFKSSRIVKKDELLAGLRIEADLLRQDIAAAENCNCGPDTKCNHHDAEIRCYSDRLTETIA